MKEFENNLIPLAIMTLCFILWFEQRDEPMRRLALVGVIGFALAVLCGVRN